MIVLIMVIRYQSIAADIPLAAFVGEVTHDESLQMAALMSHGPPELPPRLGETMPVAGGFLLLSVMTPAA